jgi:hypothetical protein
MESHVTGMLRKVELFVKKRVPGMWKMGSRRFGTVSGVTDVTLVIKEDSDLS